MHGASRKGRAWAGTLQQSVALVGIVAVFALLSMMVAFSKMNASAPPAARTSNPHPPRPTIPPKPNADARHAQGHQATLLDDDSARSEAFAKEDQLLDQAEASESGGSHADGSDDELAGVGDRGRKEAPGTRAAAAAERASPAPPLAKPEKPPERPKKQVDEHAADDVFRAVRRQKAAPAAAGGDGGGAAESEVEALEQQLKAMHEKLAKEKQIRTLRDQVAAVQKEVEMDNEWAREVERETQRERDRQRQAWDQAAAEHQRWLHRTERSSKDDLLHEETTQATYKNRPLPGANDRAAKEADDEPCPGLAVPPVESYTRSKRNVEVTAYAYATFVTSTDFVNPACVLMHSIAVSGTKYDRVIAVTTTVSDHDIRILSHFGRVVRVLTIPAPRFVENERYRDTFTKLRMWQLTAWKKVFYVDTDVVVLRSLDLVFDLEEWAVPMDALNDRYSTGMMLIKPSTDTFREMVAALQTTQISMELPDLLFLKEFFDNKKVRVTLLPRWYQVYQEEFGSNHKTYLTDNQATVTIFDPRVYGIHYPGNAKPFNDIPYLQKRWGHLLCDWVGRDELAYEPHFVWLWAHELMRRDLRAAWQEPFFAHEIGELVHDIAELPPPPATAEPTPVPPPPPAPPVPTVPLAGGSAGIPPPAGDGAGGSAAAAQQSQQPAAPAFVGLPCAVDSVDGVINITKLEPVQVNLPVLYIDGEDEAIATVDSHAWMFTWCTPFKLAPRGVTPCASAAYVSEYSQASCANTFDSGLQLSVLPDALGLTLEVESRMNSRKSTLKANLLCSLDPGYHEVWVNGTTVVAEDQSNATNADRTYSVTLLSPCFCPGVCLANDTGTGDLDLDVAGRTRPDGKCGAENPLPDGRPAECDPLAAEDLKGPCCSPRGWCGTTPDHCTVPAAVDYRAVYRDALWRRSEAQRLLAKIYEIGENVTEATEEASEGGELQQDEDTSEAGKKGRRESDGSSGEEEEDASAAENSGERGEAKADEDADGGGSASGSEESGGALEVDDAFENQHLDKRAGFSRKVLQLGAAREDRSARAAGMRGADASSGATTGRRKPAETVERRAAGVSARSARAKPAQEASVKAAADDAVEVQSNAEEADAGSQSSSGAGSRAQALSAGILPKSRGSAGSGPDRSANRNTNRAADLKTDPNPDHKLVGKADAKHDEADDPHLSQEDGTGDRISEAGRGSGQKTDAGADGRQQEKSGGADAEGDASEDDDEKRAGDASGEGERESSGARRRGGLAGDGGTAGSEQQQVEIDADADEEARQNWPAWRQRVAAKRRPEFADAGVDDDGSGGPKRGQGQASGLRGGGGGGAEEEAAADRAAGGVAGRNGGDLEENEDQREESTGGAEEEAAAHRAAGGVKPKPGLADGDTGGDLEENDDQHEASAGGATGSDGNGAGADAKPARRHGKRNAGRDAARGKSGSKSLEKAGENPAGKRGSTGRAGKGKRGGIKAVDDGDEEEAEALPGVPLLSGNASCPPGVGYVLETKAACAKAASALQEKGEIKSKPGSIPSTTSPCNIRNPRGCYYNDITNRVYWNPCGSPMSTATHRKPLCVELKKDPLVECIAKHGWLTAAELSGSVAEERRSIAVFELDRHRFQAGLSIVDYSTMPAAELSDHCTLETHAPPPLAPSANQAEVPATPPPRPPSNDELEEARAARRAAAPGLFAEAGAGGLGGVKLPFPDVERRKLFLKRRRTRKQTEAQDKADQEEAMRDAGEALGADYEARMEQKRKDKEGVIGSDVVRDVVLRFVDGKETEAKSDQKDTSSDDDSSEEDAETRITMQKASPLLSEVTVDMLEKELDKVVAEEDFILAGKFKRAIKARRTEQIEALNKRKLDAVATEDYEAAAALKEEIDGIQLLIKADEASSKDKEPPPKLFAVGATIRLLSPITFKNGRKLAAGAEGAVEAVPGSPHVKDSPATVRIQSVRFDLRPGQAVVIRDPDKDKPKDPAEGKTGETPGPTETGPKKSTKRKKRKKATKPTPEPDVLGLSDDGPGGAEKKAGDPARRKVAKSVRIVKDLPEASGNATAGGGAEPAVCPAGGLNACFAACHGNAAQAGGSVPAANVTAALVACITQCGQVCAQSLSADNSTAANASSSSLFRTALTRPKSCPNATVAGKLYANDIRVTPDVEVPMYLPVGVDVDPMHVLHSKLLVSILELPRFRGKARRPTVVDIGAGAGLFSLIAKGAGCDVDAFEPRLRYCELMACNGEGGISVHRVVASKKKVKCSLKRPAGVEKTDGSEYDVSCGSSIRKSNVMSERVDSLVQHRVNVLRVAVPGMEDIVLEGSRAIFDDFGVDFAIVSLSPGTLIAVQEFFAGRPGRTALSWTKAVFEELVPDDLQDIADPTLGYERTLSKR
ncbi:UDP-glucuronate:xylan alpha-glucuronosyltransferase 2 [Diplonema papillatum]|nr:UDP-glucuronate:xylan alpha-glucuronosyltransferase 2 [Diplonema papillatum]